MISCRSLRTPPAKQHAEIAGLIDKDERVVWNTEEEVVQSYQLVLFT